MKRLTGKYYLGLCVVFVMFGFSGCSSKPQPIFNDLPEVEQQANTHNQLQKQLNEWRGTPYQWGGRSKKGIDCSGFTQLTFSQLFHIELPRTTIAQAKMGKAISRKQLKTGDLVFFKTNWRARGGGYHVGIYQGDGLFIHASSSKGVMKSSLNDRYWRNHYWQSRRITEELSKS